MHVLLREIDIERIFCVTKRGPGAAIPNERGAYACSKDFVCRRERSVRKGEREIACLLGG